MNPDDIRTIIAAVPVVAVMLWWINDLKATVRELREQRDRVELEYINHLKGQYNIAVEMELKKRFEDQTELKQQPTQ